MLKVILGGLGGRIKLTMNLTASAVFAESSSLRGESLQVPFMIARE
jgi:hypothetical protein